MPHETMLQRCKLKPVRVRLRAANKNDAQLFYKVIKETMRGFIIATWGAWDEPRVQRESSEDCLSPHASVVLVEDAEVGVLWIEETPTHLQVRQIYLLSAYQRCGVGTQLMQEILTRAKELEKPVCLRVLRVNPAKQFYEKLGFAVIQEEAEFFYMQYPAA